MPAKRGFTLARHFLLFGKELTNVLPDHSASPRCIAKIKMNEVAQTSYHQSHTHTQRYLAVHVNKLRTSEPPPPRHRPFRQIQQQQQQRENTHKNKHGIKSTQTHTHAGGRAEKHIRDANTRHSFGLVMLANLCVVFSSGKIARNWSTVFVGTAMC